MKNKPEAFAALSRAYEEAQPNGILMPFIELGKDMRTLMSAALKESDHGIPKGWLEAVKRKASSYAKRQAYIITRYKQARGIKGEISLSKREFEILTDLSHGLSRADIASNRNISISSVKMIVNSVYFKLGAENLAALVRIAAERKLI
jgi:LuxR family maltose regulon positive regulatory protein